MTALASAGIFPASNMRNQKTTARNQVRRATYSRGRRKFDNWVAALLAANNDITLTEIAFRTRHTLPQVEASYAHICSMLGSQSC